MGSAADVLDAHGEAPRSVAVAQSAGALVDSDRRVEVLEDLGGPLTMRAGGVVAVDANGGGGVVGAHAHATADYPVDVQADGVVGAADRIVGVDVGGALRAIGNRADDLEVGGRATARRLACLRPIGR